MKLYVWNLLIIIFLESGNASQNWSSNILNTNVNLNTNNNKNLNTRTNLNTNNNIHTNDNINNYTNSNNNNEKICKIYK